jgi:hypothetical protein
MDIQSFFQLCSGKWVSQRTTHDLIAQNNQSGRSDLLSEVLSPESAEVVELCRQFNLDAAQALCSLSIRWNEVAELYQSRFKPRNEGSVLLVPLLDTASLTTGQLLRKLNATAMLGTFSLGSDEALTTRFEGDGRVTEERLWFASPNLRLRSSAVNHNGTVCVTTFCSEIRMGGPTPEAAAQMIEAQSSTTP